MLKKIIENPVLKLINNIVYVILFLIVASVLFVVILQRASNNAIALGGVRVFNIISESMIPKYNIGDVLVVKSIEPQNIKVGDDIAYIGQESTFNQKIVTHQVIKIDYENGEYIFHTKGIANILEDPLVHQNQVFGKVVYKIWILSLISKILSNVYVVFFGIFVPIVILIFWTILKLKGLVEVEEYEEEIEPKKTTKKNTKTTKSNASNTKTQKTSTRKKSNDNKG
ncbi:MAG: signal peptidase I [Clostridia bacterium]|mgnify:FL=1|jgi:signal peptidase I|nr:signal peptidase I [Clostridia bacterium]